MIHLRDTLNKAHQALQSAGIGHALIGGFALAAHGINRATADIDFLAEGTQKARIKQSLIDAGFKLILETEEVLHFEGYGNLDILLANRPAARQMLKEAKSDSRFPLLILRVEDLIGLKIQAYQNDARRALQDKADIQALISKHTKTIDWKVVKSYADLFDQWEEVKKLGGRDES